jgi:branched-chain amino acid transport system substrate-binding protein
VYQTVWGTNQPVTLSQNTYDSVIIAALAMTEAGTTDGTKWINDVADVAGNPNGVKVYNYADGVAALKAGKKINYEGASGSVDYNKYHNVAGSWDVVNFDASGNLNTVYLVPEAQIAAWTPS